MNCQEVQRLIPGFIENRLDDETMAAFLDHVAKCPKCYDELEVNYIVMVGIHQLDTDTVSSMNFSKNLKGVLAQRQQTLLNKQKEKHKRWRIGLGLLLTIIWLIVMRILYVWLGDPAMPLDYRLFLMK